MIPKILHLVWLHGRARPPVYDQLLQRFRTINPSWTAHVWSEDHCRVNKSVLSSLLPEYPTYRADVIRYEILMRYGGVYADWDILWRKPLDTLCESTDAFIGYESNFVLCNAFMGATAWHPFTTALVTRLEHAHNKHRDPAHGVGVGYVTDVCRDFRDRVTLLPKETMHRLHGAVPSTVEEATKDNGVEFGTHLYCGAYGMPFIEQVAQRADNQ